MPVNPRAFFATIAVLVVTPLFGLFVAPLISLVPGGTAHAQTQSKPAIEIAFDPEGAVATGTAVTVTITFSGLNYIDSEGLIYKAEVVGADLPKEHTCNGTGLAADISLNAGSDDLVTRIGTISSTCPEGEFILVVSLSRADEVLASAAKGLVVAPRIAMDLPEGIGSPRGLWATHEGSGKRFLIPDNSGKKVYAYNLPAYDDTFNTPNIDESSTLTHATSSSFELHSATSSPWGIITAGQTVWVSNNGSGAEDKVFAYTRAGAARDPSKDFDILQSAGNTDPTGMHGTGRHLYVADKADGKVYGYSYLDGTKEHDEDSDYPLVPENASPTGIWASGYIMWVADDEDDKVYAYDMQSKARRSDLDINALSSVGNTNPGGIWSDYTSMYVVDTVTKMLHAYPLPKRKKRPQITSGPPYVTFPENSAEIVATYTASDPESRQLSWQVYPGSSDDYRYFNMTSYGELRFNVPPDFESPMDDDKDNTYRILVMVIPGSNQYSYFPVTVTVTDVEGEQPYFTDTSTTRTIEENTPAGESIGDPVEAVPRDNDALIYALGGTDAASFGFNTSTAQIITKDALNFESKSSYSVSVSVRDGEDSSGEPSTAIDDTIDVTISLTDLEEGPEVAGPAEVAHDENDSQEVARYTATDSQNRPITWSIDGDDKDDFSITGGVLRFISTPNYEAAEDEDADNEYLVTVVATAGTEASELGVTVNVIDLNEAPTFSSSRTTRNVAEGEQLRRDVGAPVVAEDPDPGDTLTYTLGGTDVASFDIISSTGQIITDVALDFETKRSYTVTLSVSDRKDADGNATTTPDDTIDVAISVTGEDEPPLLTGTTTTDYVENGTGPVATYTATDPESQRITWGLSGDDEDAFSIAGGVLSFKSSPNYEDGILYLVTVQASDGTSTSTLSVSVYIEDVDETPVVTGDGSPEFAENSQGAVSEYEAVDPENRSITWSLSGTDSDDMDISGGDLYFNNPPNHEEQDTYNVIVQAFDGSSTGTLPVVITITDVNEDPEFSDTTTTRTVEENSGAYAVVGLPVVAEDPDSGDTLTYALSGTGAASFTIDSNGQIRTKSDTDSDIKDIYNVTVQVHDGKGDDGSVSTTTDDYIDVTITVTDVNEPPVLTGSTSVELAENSTTTVATYTATDPERVTPTWDLSGDDEDDFEITGGVLTFKSLPDREGATDKNTDSVYHVTVEASDGNNTAKLDVTITVTNVNEKPAFSENFADRSVVENTTAGVKVGDPIKATDPEGDALTYTLIGSVATAFEIDSSGQLKTKILIDREAATSYFGQVQVRDSKDADGNSDTNVDASTSVVVTVEDINEPPVVSGTTTTEYPENDTRSVETYSADDPETDDITWSLSGVDEDDFEITQGGVLDFATTPDYEAPADIGPNNVYQVDVLAADGTSTTTHAVTVTVTNVNEDPVFPDTEDGLRTVVENTLAGVNVGNPIRASDPEGDSLTYTLTGNIDTAFEISSSGQLIPIMDDYTVFSLTRIYGFPLSRE